MQEYWDSLLARRAGDRKIGVTRHVSDRIVSPEDQVGKSLDHLARADLHLVKWQAEMRRQRPGVRALVGMRTPRIASAEGVHGSGVFPGGEHGDRARVHSTTQGDPDRHVRANDDLADLLELGPNERGGISFDWWSIFHPPVAGLFDRPGLNRRRQPVTGRELSDPHDGRQGLGHVLIVKEEVYRIYHSTSPGAQTIGLPGN